MSSTYEDHVHDKKACDEEALSLPKGTRLWQDIGFGGNKRDGIELCMPKKKSKGKELTPDEKQEKREFPELGLKLSMPSVV